MSKLKKCISSALTLCVMLGLFTDSKAVTVNTNVNLNYSTVIYGYDSDNKYKFRQDGAQWSGKALGVWPSGHYIYYSPYTQDYTQAGAFVFLSYIGDESYQENYFSGYGYKSNYRIGTSTSASSVDTTFSFYV